jgi:hypothetical protein
MNQKIMQQSKEGLPSEEHKFLEVLSAAMNSGSALWGQLIYQNQLSIKSL